MGQKPRELQPYTSLAAFFGAELRRLRLKAGLTQRDLAARVNFHFTLIGKVEIAERFPTPELADACDEALAADGMLTRLCALTIALGRHEDRPSSVLRINASNAADQGCYAAERDQGPELVSGWPGTTDGGEIADEGDVTMSMTRRQLLRSSGGALPLSMAAGLGASPAPAHAVEPSHLGSDTLDSFRRMLAEHSAMDNAIGPRYLFDVVRAQLGVLVELRQVALPAVRGELLGLCARYAEFAGWLCQDSGDARGATAWCDRALEWAQAAGDDAMTAFVLIRKANQATARRDYDYAVSLASAAQADRGPASRPMRVLAALQQAHSHAAGGGSGGCDQALEAANSLLETEADGASGTDEPVLARYCELGLYLEIKRAVCDVQLGRTAAAVAGLSRIIDTLPPAHQRDRGQYMAQLAAAHAAAGEVEQACAVAGEALTIARSTGSQRTIAEVRGLSAQLDHAAMTPAVRLLRESLIVPT